VVVLDDAHHADAEETVALLDALADLVARRSIRLLLVGRDPIESVIYSPLPGLTEREAQLLWAGSPPLPSEQWRVLYATTGGMPEPIRRAAAAYRRSGDLARPTDWVDEVEAWAREAIWGRLAEDEQRLLAAAHALAAHPWGEQTTLVCGTLAIPAETLKPLLLRGLLRIDNTQITLYPALRAAAAACLREEDSLRERTAALAAALSSAAAGPAAEAEATHRAPDDVEPQLGAAPVASGLELLERVRNALEDSAEYLQEQGDDLAARQLATELAALQAALPDLSEPRLPFARQVAGTPST
jgi:hypothetical protein